MSRIGKLPIEIVNGVKVEINGNEISVNGPKGNLKTSFDPSMDVAVEDNFILVKRSSDDEKCRSLHGLTRSLIYNMIKGVTDGFRKDLEVNGVGYRVQKQGKNLVMNLGFSHQVVVPEVEGITVEVKDQNSISVIGADKQKVGQFAAEIRAYRPPEPYKGKGIKYVTEVIKRKAGKAGKGAK